MCHLCANNVYACRLIISPTLSSTPSALKHQVKILFLWCVFFHLPSLPLSCSLCHFLSFILSLTHTHILVPIQNAQIRDRRHARFFLSLLFAFYWLWPQSVLLSPSSPICSLLLLFLYCLIPLLSASHLSSSPHFHYTFPLYILYLYFSLTLSVSSTPLISVRWPLFFVFFYLLWTLE